MRKKIESLLKQESDMNGSKLMHEDDWSIVSHKDIYKGMFGLNSNNFHISTTLVDVFLFKLKYKFFHIFNTSYLGNEYVRLLNEKVKWCFT